MFQALSDFIGRLPITFEGVERAANLNKTRALISKLNSLGDLRSFLARLGSTTNLFRSLRTDRIENTMLVIQNTQHALLKVIELRQQIGDPKVLRDRLAALHDIEVVLPERRDIDDLCTRLGDPDDLSHKLDYIAALCSEIDRIGEALTETRAGSPGAPSPLSEPVADLPSPI